MGDNKILVNTALNPRGAIQQKKRKKSAVDEEDSGEASGGSDRHNNNNINRANKERDDQLQDKLSKINVLIDNDSKADAEVKNSEEFKIAHSGRIMECKNLMKKINYNNEKY